MTYRGLIASVLMTASLLTGCTPSAEQTAQRITQRYETANAWFSEVSMTVDLGDQTANFLLNWDVTPTESRITVAEPTELSGLGVTVSDDGQTVTYEDAAIVLPRTDGTKAPMPTEALCLIRDAWRYGVYSAVATEQDGEKTLIRIDYRGAAEGDTTEISSWFDKETLLPVRTEVISDGVRLVDCTFGAFSAQ